MKTDILSVRLPSNIIEYFRKNGYNPRSLLEHIYSEKRKNEIPELQKAIEEHKKSIDGLTKTIADKIREKEECITKMANRNTPNNEMPVPAIDLKAIAKERKRRRKRRK